MSGLIVLKPFQVTPESMDSSVPEDDYPAYAAGTTYAEDQRVLYLHNIYQSLQAGNTGKTPDTEPLWWVLVGPDNRWRVFDRSHTTQTKANQSMWYEIAPGQVVSSVALLNMDGISSAKIKMTDPDYGVVYERTFEFPRIQGQASWHSWFFGKRKVRRDFNTIDIPSFPNATIRIELNGLAEIAIGVILIGEVFSFGEGVKRGMRLGIRDYSRKETDQWGETTLQKRAFSKIRSANILLSNNQLDEVEQFLTDIRAAPVLWIASDRYDAPNVYGWYSSFEILLQYVNHSECSIDIEGLS